jgi:hypothetical protein
MEREGIIGMGYYGEEKKLTRVDKIVSFFGSLFKFLAYVAILVYFLAIAYSLYTGWVLEKEIMAMQNTTLLENRANFELLFKALNVTK